MQVNNTTCNEAWSGFKELLHEKSSKVHGISVQYIPIGCDQTSEINIRHLVLKLASLIYI